MSFRVKDADQAAVHRFLTENGVVCALRGGGIRFSPHFYTPSEGLDLAFEILGRFPG